uniref:Alcohol-forming fatty acyl-CoA reductase-like n=1 Tax=Tanacetum cinerariifolium TaxID=118510 RepID=A0A6L2LPJ5_TANCI|nr:alcohol-forming fatty acyl-CoA reductase-like [Tanacetum cinerariifolium]
MDEEDSRALKRLSENQDDKTAKKQKFDEEVEELKRHLHIVPNDEDYVYTEATSLAVKVPVVDYEIYTKNNNPYYKIKRADGSHQLYLSFLSMLRNFDREYLEVLWRLVKERFTSTKPKNFSDDFLLATLGAMFEKPDIQAQIWKNQRSVHGQAKVKSWKLLESCGVHIITFTTTQLILLVDRRYPLTRFTLDQMLNNVRLEVEEESEHTMMNTSMHTRELLFSNSSHGVKRKRSNGLLVVHKWQTLGYDDMNTQKLRKAVIDSETKDFYSDPRIIDWEVHTHISGAVKYGFE